ncbi:MAG: hypothetical protein ABJA75_02755 [Bradyrhizobium sp.]
MQDSLKPPPAFDNSDVEMISVREIVSLISTVAHDRHAHDAERAAQTVATP